jgi:hypothetical protein
VSDPQDPAAVADVSGVVVALLAAYLAGDAEGMELVAEGNDAWPLVGMLVGMLQELALATYGGREAYAAALAAWRPGTRLGDDLSNPHGGGL